MRKTAQYPERVSRASGRLRRGEEGFAMVAALLAILILTAVGVIVFTVTTRDVRISSRVTGEKKAFSAAEAGVQRLIQESNANAGNITAFLPINTVVNIATDPDSKYTITPSPSALTTKLPPSIPEAGFEIGGVGTNKSWGQTVSSKRVAGENTRYGSKMEVDVGVGYGPVEISTGQPAAGG